MTVDFEVKGCRCGLAMYAYEADDGQWYYVCEDCDMVEIGKLE